MKKALAGTSLLLLSSTAQAALSAADDSFGVPFNAPLHTELYAVLGNDSIDGVSAAQLGATAKLVAGPSHGTLSCPKNGTVALCPDGSFNYLPNGTTDADSFTYRFSYGSSLSNLATVELTACSGGPSVFTCWAESSYLAKLAQFGYVTFSESFEGNAWDSTREPDSAVSISSKRITWRSNHPTTNGLTTGKSVARTGVYGLYDPDHGSASGTSATCDTANPPSYCLYHDGFSGSRPSSEGALHGVGGYFHGTFGAHMGITLDGINALELGKLQGTGWQFFGVIDTDPNGFGVYEFRELDGKVGQMRIIFGDDFTLAVDTPLINKAPMADAGPGQAVPVGATVSLDGSASRDLNGDALHYRWSFISKPIGSAARLSDPTAVGPGFSADLAGNYVVQLIVSDGILDSNPDTVTITSGNSSSGNSTGGNNSSGESTPVAQSSGGGGGSGMWLIFLTAGYAYRLTRKKNKEFSPCRNTR